MTRQIKIAEFWQTLSHNKLKFDQYHLGYTFSIPNNAIAAITLVNGRCESYLKYQELAYNIYQKGFAVFLFDHLGQGCSSRLLANPHKGHIDHFDSYIDGLDTFVKDVVIANWQGKHYLLAHSMGAAISYLYLASRAHPFSCGVLSAPMFGIPTNGLPFTFAHSLAWVLTKLGLGKYYFLGQQNYQAKPFENNQLMQCETRYKEFRELYSTHPYLQLGGVTIGWLRQAFSAITKMKKCAPSLPIMMLQAEKDTIVLNHAQDAIVEKHININKITYQNSLHEILFEIDTIREQALSDIDRFFKKDLYE